MMLRLPPDNLTPVIRPWMGPVLLLCFLVLFPSLCQADRKVKLAWDANKEKTLKGYRVFCRKAGDAYNYRRPIWDGSAAKCKLIGLEKYTDYAFVVRAYDVHGNESADSQEVWLSGKTAVPSQPETAGPQDGASDLFMTPVLRTDPFESDDHTDRHLKTRWIITRESDERCVLDVTSSNYLTELDVPPLVLEENTLYSWVVQYTSAKGVVSDWSSSSRFTTGLSALDHDGDGLPDDQAVDNSIDLDNNGVPDAQQSDLCCVNVRDGKGQMAICAPKGSGVRRISAMEATDLSTLSAADRSRFDLPLGLIGFRLETKRVGGIVRIRAHFSHAAPQAAKWVKYDNVNGWQDYSAHAVFARDRRFVDIEIQDGGFGDADGVANGIIIDPSGYGVATGNTAEDNVDEVRSVGNTAPAAAAYGSAGGGGGGCFISTLQP
jgi:hypothetical protein